MYSLKSCELFQLSEIIIALHGKGDLSVFSHLFIHAFLSVCTHRLALFHKNVVIIICS